MKKQIDEIRIFGVDPVLELRQVGFQIGLGEDELVEGDGINLSFDSSSFDIVCSFGVLHHVPEPSKVIAEMLRDWGAVQSSGPK